jgi:hypothetical protein
MFLFDFQGDPHLGLSTVWGSGPGDVWASGGFGMLRWNGWSSVACLPYPVLNIGSIHGTGPDDIWGISINDSYHRWATGFVMPSK